MPLGFRSPVMEPRLKRTQFLNAVRSIAGVKPVACWLPSFTDTGSSIDPISGRVWTADAAQNGQVQPKGYGYARTFNGTSNWFTTPDTTDLSFVEPVAMSIFAVANVTDTANNRYFISKGNTVATDLEYVFVVQTTDVFVLSFNDNSAAVQCQEASNAAITQGSWITTGASYSGVGGATAANGIVLYQNGAAVAETATNNAAYVAMEDHTALVMIGARNTAVPTGFFQGSMAFLIAVAANLTAAQQTQLHLTAKTYFGI